MNYMMVTSDPVITSLRKPATKSKDPLPHEVLQLLVAAEPSTIEDGEDMDGLDNTEDTDTEDSEDENTDEEDEVDVTSDQAKVLKFNHG